MTKYLVLLLLFSVSLLFAAKDKTPKWISFPQEQSDTLLSNTFFKTEFKLKDSVKIAYCQVAASSQFSLWVNSNLLIINGVATKDSAQVNINAINIAPYLLHGYNAIAVRILPDAPYKSINASLWLNLKIDKNMHIFSNKDFMCYKDYSTHYKVHDMHSTPTLTCHINPKQSIVGNWKAARFNHKKLSPLKWENAQELYDFIPKAHTQSHIPFSFANSKTADNLELPLSIKLPETVVAKLSGNQSKLVEITIESIKDKVISIYTPEMKTLGLAHTYRTTFGLQTISLPTLIKSDSLYIDFNEPVKIIAINYRTIND